MSGELHVQNLGKSYRQWGSEWRRVASWFAPAIRPREEHWVLKDVSFSVGPGEAVGIVGQNGAGKSTLLKLITGTTRPTQGGVRVRGRVAAILELGMGFNPDLTGRQNAYHSAGLMGHSQADIERTMPEIEAFAEVGEYFDQPVRTYSSGMQMRVAFSVATAFRPEILIIDEALSVGDAAFQRKCFQRIEAFLAAGTTLLFVSHDTETVKKLCSRALFIKNGRLERFDVAKQVCDEYEKYLFGGNRSSAPAQARVAEPTKFDPSLAASCELVYGNGKAEIESCWLENQEGQRINVAETGQPFVWRYRVKFNEKVANPIVAMMLKTREGVMLYGVDSKQLGVAQRSYSPGEIIDVRFGLSNCLAPGVYYLNCGVRLDHEGGTEFLSRRVDAVLVRITHRTPSTVVGGVLDMDAKLTTTAVETTYD